jgi:hypothetical protein
MNGNEERKHAEASDAHAPWQKFTLVRYEDYIVAARDCVKPIRSQPLKATLIHTYTHWLQK